MDPSELISVYQSGRNHSELMKKLGSDSAVNISLDHLGGSSKSLVLASCLSELKHMNHLVVLNDKEAAAYFYNDLSGLRPLESIQFFPSSFKRSVQFANLSRENNVLRSSVLESARKKKEGNIIISYPAALIEKVISRKDLKENTFNLRQGDKLSLSFLTDFLDGYGFMSVDYVYEPGQYSIRGSILDIFSFSDKTPCRIDFFGDEIDSIRSFNIDNQLSIAKIKDLSIVPDFQLFDTETLSSAGNRISLIEYLGKNTLVWVEDQDYIIGRIDQVYGDTDPELLAETDHISISDKSELLITAEELETGLRDLKVVQMNGRAGKVPVSHITYSTSLQPVFNKNFELLQEDLEHMHEEGYSSFILSDNPKQLDRIRSIFEDLEVDTSFTDLILVLHEGFIDHELKIALYTDHQIFDRYHKFNLDEHFTRKESLSIRELTGLHPGDYVVHIDHGIGQFGGLEKIDLNGREQEAIKLVYKDNDILYVSIHSLHRISKYKGKDSHPPKIYKLGTGTWQKLKQKTKNRVKDIARELIDLYAKRRGEKGFGFSPDSYLQQELEASFIYEDTDDQLNATRDTKESMEAGFPMDRLVCGDVGFGKTEVAIRAAFKAVTDSKQVAVLVPTTILALQHYKTFSERLAGFPCSVEYLSRLKNQKDQKAIIEKLASGQLDIVIGTHRIVSADIRFKDLGLLIIDEEQKFGVAVKEKLRKLRINVDTLTLTATPIPRTLQLSLMGARDLSIINTPPPNRHPIVTELHTFNEGIIKEAIEYEVSRNGQVFIIHNRVQNIEEIKKLVDQLCPDVKTVIAHGQMEGSRLERIMLDFIEGYYDVLIATTIIESGLDIPNANTMIVNNAHHFGLSDLHQLRGRVGRSNKKAFCYLLAPPLTLLTPEARRRLKAIEDFSELGSGFNIAMQDLDIRGAGNLLGGEQSGFIAEIGFETYHRILDEALQELKDNEFRELYSVEGKEEQLPATAQFISDCHIDTDMELLFPDSYIENVSERLRLYRILDGIKSPAQLSDFRDQLLDRFGQPPEQTIQLMNVVRLRWIAVSLGFEKIILKKDKMIMHFIADQESAYYRSEAFSGLMQRIQKQAQKFRMREQSGKLTLTTDNISTVADAIEMLDQLSQV